MRVDAPMLVRASQAYGNMPAPTILVVDDEQAIRALLVRWSRRWGYAAREAASAGEALDSMAAAPADIVVCDVGMPDRDGLWLAEELRHRFPAAAIVMATGIDESVIVHTSRRLGAVAYVTKPFDPVQLRQALDHAAGREHFRPSAEATVAPA